MGIKRNKLWGDCILGFFVWKFVLHNVVISQLGQSNIETKFPLRLTELHSILQVMAECDFRLNYKACLSRKCQFVDVVKLRSSLAAETT